MDQFHPQPTAGGILEPDFLLFGPALNGRLQVYCRRGPATAGQLGEGSRVQRTGEALLLFPHPRPLSRDRVGSPGMRFARERGE